jgi:hypothetical protein
MERYPSSSADQGSDATAVINETLEENGTGASNDKLAREIEQAATERGLEKETANYVHALREQSHSFVVDALPPGVGGQFDGSSIDVAPGVLIVDRSIEETVDRMKEVTAHEAYHAMHNHTDAMMTYAGEPTVVIAGEEFSTTDIIEGLTVADTGNQFVSDEYQEMEERVRRATARAGIGLDGAREAVNQAKDLTTIDDRRVSPSLAIAA